MKPLTEFHVKQDIIKSKGKLMTGVDAVGEQPYNSSTWIDSRMAEAVILMHDGMKFCR